MREIKGDLKVLRHLEVGGDIDIQNNKELRFYDDGANYVGFEAPALDADQIWVLPDADGDDGDVLTTDGLGNLTWEAPSAGADVKVAIDAEATAGYLGAASNDGVLRVTITNGLTYTDGGDFITIGFDADYADISGNDAATDVTGAELETLTDGSDADALHIHGSYVGTHTLLDGGTVHTDTATDSVTRGSIIVGNATPAWDELVIGAAGTVLYSNGTDAAWSAYTLDNAYNAGKTITIDDGAITFDLNNSTNTILDSDVDITYSGSVIANDSFSYDELLLPSAASDDLTKICYDIDITTDTANLSGLCIATQTYTLFDVDFNYENDIGEGIVMTNVTFLDFDWAPGAIATGYFANWKFNTSSRFTVDVLGNTHIYGAFEVDGTSQFDSSINVGTNGTGHDVIFYSDTSGAYFKWDDAQNTGLTIGTNGTGADVTFYGDTVGRYMQWDQSEDLLVLASGVNISFNGDNLTENIVENLRATGKITLRPESDVVVDYTSSFAESTANDGILDSLVESSTGPKPYMNWRAVSGISALQYCAVVYQVMVPQDFGSWTTSNAIQVDYKTTSTSSTYNRVAVDVYDTAGTKAYDGSSVRSTSWTTLNLSATNISGTYTPGSMMYIVVRLSSYSDSYYAFCRNIVLNYNRDI